MHYSCLDKDLKVLPPGSFLRRYRVFLKGHYVRRAVIPSTGDLTQALFLKRSLHATLTLFESSTNTKTPAGYILLFTKRHCNRMHTMESNPINTSTLAQHHGLGLIPPSYLESISWRLRKRPRGSTSYVVLPSLLPLSCVPFLFLGRFQNYLL